MNTMKEAVRAIEKYQPLWGFWKVGELIGQGGGCEVYKVYKEEWGKRYTSTVKYMSFTVGQSDIKEAQALGIEEASMPEYFKSIVGSIHNEVELMYRLRGNSNILSYEDHAIYQKKSDLGWDVLIRMEHLQSLPDCLKGRELVRGEVIRLGIDICKALEACGKEGIIHRDIKDTSIFVSPKGEFKLGSFSLAKELVKGGRTAPAQFSPLYMAPELYKEQSYDSSIDIYSLGLVMYKLLNKGRLPFMPLPPDNITVDDTEKSLARRMSGEELPLPADADESLGVIVLKACSYDRKDRYKSPNEFRQKLERTLKAELKSAKADSMQINNIAECAAANTEPEESPVQLDKGEADAQAAYAEELEKVAVVELVASIGKLKSAKRLARKKALRNFSICAVVMAAAFGLAFLNAYEVMPPSMDTPTVIIKATPSPTAASTVPPTAALAATPLPMAEKTGEEYYREGLAFMRKKRYGSALAAFEEARKLGYDYSKVSAQIRAIRKNTEVKKLAEQATAYYKQQAYEKAIAAFGELAKIDAAYGSSEQYADSYFQLAARHNSLGMQYFNEGRPEQSVRAFEAALGTLGSMSNSLKSHDFERYLKWQGIYTENKSRLQEKMKEIQEHFKLAAASNKAGVDFFTKGYYDKAKQEFEKALKHMEDIRLLVPKYSSDGYEGLRQIYEDNLSRTEKKL